MFRFIPVSRQIAIAGYLGACMITTMLTPQNSNAAVVLKTKGHAALESCATQYKVPLPLPKKMDKVMKQTLRNCVIAKGYMPAGYKKRQEQIASCLSKEGISLPEGARTPADDKTKEVIRQCRERVKKQS